MVDTVARQHYFAVTCTYCGRPFSATVRKHIDHEPPLCRNGRVDDPNGARICCEDCNRSKAKLTYNEWIALCERVLAYTRARHSLVRVAAEV